jgi:hypothetical protein
MILIWITERKNKREKEKETHRQCSFDCLVMVEQDPRDP